MCETTFITYNPEIFLMAYLILLATECEDGELFPHETDCTKYYKCYNKELIQEACPSNLEWDYDGQYCDFAGKAKCPNSSFDYKNCPQEGEVLVAHETECHLYYSCEWGLRTLMECPKGLHFNVKAQYCDQPADSQCVDNPTKHLHLKQQRS